MNKLILNGSKLRSIREAQGLTLDELSNLVFEKTQVRVSIQSLSRWESFFGSKPTQRNLKAVCSVIGVDIDELYYEESENTYIPKDIIKNSENNDISDAALIYHLVEWMSIKESNASSKRDVIEQIKILVKKTIQKEE